MQDLRVMTEVKARGARRPRAMKLVVAPESMSVLRACVPKETILTRWGCDNEMPEKTMGSGWVGELRAETSTRPELTLFPVPLLQ